jgi:hypothetical protein
LPEWNLSKPLSFNGSRGLHALEFEPGSPLAGDDDMSANKFMLVAASVFFSSAAYAQNAPAPGAASPPAAGSKTTRTIVINPTAEECRRGWNAKLKWTRAQFDEFCTKLRASK